LVFKGLHPFRNGHLFYPLQYLGIPFIVQIEFYDAFNKVVINKPFGKFFDAYKLLRMVWVREAGAIYDG
jgi:hypothetical protein